MGLNNLRQDSLSEIGVSKIWMEFISSVVKSPNVIFQISIFSQLCRSLSEHFGINLCVWQAHVMNKMRLHLRFAHTLHSKNIWLLCFCSCKHGLGVSSCIENTLLVKIVGCFEVVVFHVHLVSGFALHRSQIIRKWFRVWCSIIHKIVGFSLNFVRHFSFFLNKLLNKFYQYLQNICIFSYFRGFGVLGFWGFGFRV